MCKKIAIFLDVDGVLNQYRISERKRRLKTKGKNKIFDPFPKKIKRISKYVTKYNIDVHLFSAWSKEKLMNFLPFNIIEDTRKSEDKINEISRKYKLSIIIDDEISHYKNINANIIKIQPDYIFGFIKKDELILKKILKEYYDKT